MFKHMKIDIIPTYDRNNSNKTVRFRVDSIKNLAFFLLFSFIENLNI